MRFAHVNLVAVDLDRIVSFYVDVFGCKHIHETRDLRGDWIDAVTNIPKVHVVGEHLVLPSDSDSRAITLEIFQYDPALSNSENPLNMPGFTHIAFEVDDVQSTLEAVLAHGGSTAGALREITYPDGRHLTIVYARDPEGNIVELQSWKETTA